MSEQCYLFTVPGDELVWCEMYTSDGHYVAPMPYTDMSLALVALMARHPYATVDEMCDSAEIDAGSHVGAYVPA